VLIELSNTEQLDAVLGVIRVGFTSLPLVNAGYKKYRFPE
jgi:hypothetical protein